MTPNLDSTGTHARTVADAAAVLSAFVGVDPRDPCTDLQSMRQSTDVAGMAKIAVTSPYVITQQLYGFEKTFLDNGVTVGLRIPAVAPAQAALSGPFSGLTSYLGAQLASPIVYQGFGGTPQNWINGVAKVLGQPLPADFTPPAGLDFGDLTVRYGQVAQKFFLTQTFEQNWVDGVNSGLGRPSLTPDQVAKLVASIDQGATIPDLVGAIADGGATPDTLYSAFFGTAPSECQGRQARASLPLLRADVSLL